MGQARGVRCSDEEVFPERMEDRCGMKRKGGGSGDDRGGC